MDTVTSDLGAVLGQLVERLDRLERKVDALSARDGLATLDQLSLRAPQIADAAGRTAQVAWDEATAAGIDPFALYHASLPLMVKAAQPEAVAVLGRMLDRLEDVTFTLDTLDKLDAGLKGAGVERALLAERSIELASKLAALTLARNTEVTALVEGGPLERETLDVVGKATRALVEARKDPAQPAGLFATLRAMGDADIQRAVGFGLQFARRFGQLLGR